MLLQRSITVALFLMPHNNSDKKKLAYRSWKANLKYRYGLTAEEYDKKLFDQSGLCAICQSPPDGNRRLDVDHNHATNKVRSLLCMKCNVLLGMFDDKIEVSQRVVEYLKRWNE